MDFFQRRFRLLPDRLDLVSAWRTLVQSFAIKGFAAHDARIAAAMQTHGVSQILTFNVNHFKQLPITILDPATI